MRKFSGFFVLVAIACLFSVTCCNYQLPGEELYPFQNFSTTDEQIRYILADYSLNDDCTAPYGPGLYKRFPVVEQALLLWDQGVRVVNIDRFSRLNQPHTIKIGSIPVVITGLVFDGVTLDLLDAKNVILTTDAKASEETPIPTEASENSAIPTEGSSFDLCNNPYWPIVEGASWEYHRFNPSVDNGEHITKSISNVQNNQFTYTDGGNILTNLCQQEGIRVSGQPIQLPAENKLNLGYQIDENGYITSVDRTETVSVPAGTFSTVVITYTSKSDNRLLYSFYYAQGIGIIKEIDEDLKDTEELVGYNIPGVGTLVVEIPTPKLELGVCENPYWPIILGAKWTYQKEDSTDTRTITEINNQIAGRTDFVVFKEVKGGSSYSAAENYHCDSTGIYFEVSGVEDALVLPPANNMIIGFSWGQRQYEGVHEVQPEHVVSTPYGNLNAIEISVTWSTRYITEDYVSGIGLIKTATSDGNWQLIDYSFP